MEDPDMRQQKLDNQVNRRGLFTRFISFTRDIGQIYMARLQFTSIT